MVIGEAVEEIEGGRLAVVDLEVDKDGEREMGLKGRLDKDGVEESEGDGDEGDGEEEGEGVDRLKFGC